MVAQANSFDTKYQPPAKETRTLARRQASTAPRSPKSETGSPTSETKSLTNATGSPGTARTNPPIRPRGRLCEPTPCPQREGHFPDPNDPIRERDCAATHTSP